MHMKILPLIVGAFGSLLLAGCGDDGEEPASGCVSRCEKDTKVTCVFDHDAGQPSEARNNCAETGKRCAVAAQKTGTPAAVCVLSAERLADCEGHESTCQSNYVTTCYDGYPLTREDCDTSNRVCFGDGTHAACVFSATPEPKCADSGNIWVCDGDVTIHCFAGRAASKHDCVGCTVSGVTLIDSTGKSCI